IENSQHNQSQLKYEIGQLQVGSSLHLIASVRNFLKCTLHSEHQHHTH
ncbi:hypothetical protein LINPERPRIM_LOCUS20436, partial [Linum perenne]